MLNIHSHRKFTNFFLNLQKRPPKKLSPRIFHPFIHPLGEIAAFAVDGIEKICRQVVRGIVREDTEVRVYLVGIAGLQDLRQFFMDAAECLLNYFSGKSPDSPARKIISFRFSFFVSGSSLFRSVRNMVNSCTARRGQTDRSHGSGRSPRRRSLSRS